MCFHRVEALIGKGKVPFCLHVPLHMSMATERPGGVPHLASCTGEDRALKRCPQTTLSPISYFILSTVLAIICCTQKVRLASGYMAFGVRGRDLCEAFSV